MVPAWRRAWVPRPKQQPPTQQQFRRTGAGIPRPSRSDEAAGARAEAVDLDPEALEHAEEKVAEGNATGSGRWIRPMLAVRAATAGQNDGQVVVRVRTRIPHAAAKKNHGVI